MTSPASVPRHTVVASLALLWALAPATAQAPVLSVKEVFALVTGGSQPGGGSHRTVSGAPALITTASARRRARTASQ